MHYSSFKYMVFLSYILPVLENLTLVTICNFQSIVSRNLTKECQRSQLAELLSLELALLTSAALQQAALAIKNISNLLICIIMIIFYHQHTHPSPISNVSVAICWHKINSRQALPYFSTFYG